MTLPQLRHDIRNQLNTIKLSCALIQRRADDPLVAECVRDIERAADRINELVSRHMGDDAGADLSARGS